MQRTYPIKYVTLGGIKYDKVVYRSKEDRPRFHKCEALTEWKRSHKGYHYLNINNVYTLEEFKKRKGDVVMNAEVMEKIMKRDALKKYKKNAKALYLLSDIGEAYMYLYDKVDMEYLTEEEVDKIISEISDECRNMLVGQIEDLKKLF